MQGRGRNPKRLPPVVLPTLKEESYVAAVPQRDPHPGPGAQPDGGGGGHRAVRRALHTGTSMGQIPGQIYQTRTLFTLGQ